jgi:hypothetical protein
VPAVGLGRAVPEAAEHLEDHVGPDGVGLAPAVHHVAGLAVVAVHEGHEAAVDAQVARVLAVVVAQVGEVGGELADRRVALALALLVHGPAERLAGGGGQQLREAEVGARAPAPPGADAGLHAAVAHGLDVAGDDLGRARVVVAGRRPVDRERVLALLAPGLGNQG